MMVFFSRRYKPVYCRSILRLFVLFLLLIPHQLHAYPFTIIEKDAWPAGSNTIILTIDDGPNGKISNDLLEVLKKYDVKATFFYVGRNVEKHPDIVKRAYEEGHQIGIHSFDRNYPPFFTISDLTQDINRSVEAIRNAIKVNRFQPRLYRPPKGMKTPAVKSLIKESQFELGYLNFYVHDSPTTSEDHQKTLEKIKDKIRKHQGGAIVLHESQFKRNLDKDNLAEKNWLPEAVKELIVWAHKHGYVFERYKSGNKS